MLELYKGNSRRRPWLIEPENLLQCSSVKGGYSLGLSAFPWGCEVGLSSGEGKLGHPNPRSELVFLHRGNYFALLQIYEEINGRSLQRQQNGPERVSEVGISPSNKSGTIHSSQGLGVGRVFFLFKHLPVIYSVVLTVAGCPGKTK